MSTRLQPRDRKAQILDGALELACKTGLNNLTRESIATHVGVSPGLVSRYLGTMIELRRTVMRAAIKREALNVIAEGVVSRDKHALKAPVELQQRALSAALSK